VLSAVLASIVILDFLHSANNGLHTVLAVRSDL
jgi:hypothetical protein